MICSLVEKGYVEYSDDPVPFADESAVAFRTGELAAFWCETSRKAPDLARVGGRWLSLGGKVRAALLQGSSKAEVGGSEEGEGLDYIALPDVKAKDIREILRGMQEPGVVVVTVKHKSGFKEGDWAVINDFMAREGMEVVFVREAGQHAACVGLRVTGRGERLESSGL